MGLYAYWDCFCLCNDIEKIRRYNSYPSNDMKHTISLIGGMKVQKPISNFACHMEHRDDYVVNDSTTAITSVLKLDHDILIGQL